MFGHTQSDWTKPHSSGTRDLVLGAWLEGHLALVDEWVTAMTTLQTSTSSGSSLWFSGWAPKAAPTTITAWQAREEPRRRSNANQRPVFFLICT
jgi:hypothetical protein